MKLRLFLLFFTSILLINCNLEKDFSEKIISKAIQSSGGELYENCFIKFDFREIEYTILRNNGEFAYTRTLTQEGKSILDSLTNDGFTRSIGNEQINISDSLKSNYQNALNSVIYFSLLPFGLEDKAVISEYLGQKEIEGKLNEKVKISFRKADGGADHEDTFIYWLDAESFQINYMAYQFHVDGGGFRFRKAVNPRRVNGILFLDYENYLPKENVDATLNDLDDLYLSGQLKILSQIDLENIEVEINK